MKRRKSELEKIKGMGFTGDKNNVKNIIEVANHDNNVYTYRYVDGLESTTGNKNN